jgi:hypothetical protein
VSFYPEIRAGDDVVFSTNPNEVPDQWRYGKVMVPKNNSCDIAVHFDNHIEYRSDCLHADDPRITTTRIWAEPGRGVFRLAAGEIERRADRLRLADIEKKLIRLEAGLEDLVVPSARGRKQPA